LSEISVFKNVRFWTGFLAQTLSDLVTHSPKTINKVKTMVINSSMKNTS
jgi:hypothetical protein